MITLPASSSVYVCGDIHKGFPRFQNYLNHLPTRSTVILLGDYDAHDKNVLLEYKRLFERLGMLAILLRGNHDKPEFWQNRKLAQELQSPHFYLCEEVDHLRWKNFDFLTVNGAISVDRKALRFHRGKSYPASEPMPTDALKIVQSLKSEVTAFHSLFTHTGVLESLPIQSPFVESFVPMDPNLINDLNEERNQLLKIQLASRAKHHYFGHFHRSETELQFGVTARCLNICEIMAIDAS